MLEDLTSQTEGANSGLDEFLEKHKLVLATFLFGIILLGIGVLSLVISNTKSSKIEIISEGDSLASVPENNQMIYLDIGGAVINPGLYQLPANSRINDLLIASGGLAGDADREWFEKNANLAQRLTDGAKIYIPRKNEKGTLGSQMGDLIKGASVVGEGAISVNNASAAELDRLWGVGPATAQKIIENRPYASLDELLTKKVLKKNVYEANLEKMTLY